MLRLSIVISKENHEGVDENADSAKIDSNNIQDMNGDHDHGNRSVPHQNDDDGNGV